MTKQTYVISAKVWRWPGDMGWYFVTIDRKTSSQIKESASTYGAGFVRVTAKIGKTEWQTALFPHTKPFFEYLIAIKNIVRKKESIFEGDAIRCTITLLL